MGIFLFFDVAMASLAGATLIWRSSFLDRLWALNARAYYPLARFDSAVGVAFLVLGAVLVIAGRGWFLPRSRRWGLAAALVAAQTLGSVASASRGEFLGGGKCGRFPQEGFSSASHRVSLYLYVIQGVGNPA